MGREAVPSGHSRSPDRERATRVSCGQAGKRHDRALLAGQARGHDPRSVRKHRTQTALVIIFSTWSRGWQ